MPVIWGPGAVPLGADPAVLILTHPMPFNRHGFKEP
jgi:hypothetical protein